MKEQLTIEQLAPYLPYGVKVLRPDGKTQLEIKGIHGDLIWFDEINSEGETTIGDLKACKPILRPLLSMTKEEISEWSKIVGNLKKTLFDEISSNLSGTTYLFSKHIDVFGLIEKGLAVNINTLKQQMIWN